MNNGMQMNMEHYIMPPGDVNNVWGKTLWPGKSPETGENEGTCYHPTY